MMKPPMTFGQWLKKLRAEQDLTQEMLSEWVGCATPTLRAFEIGRRRPSREMAERIADVLKVPADQRGEFLRLARQVIGNDGNETEEADADAPLRAQSATTTLPPVTQVLIGREAECNALATLLLDEHCRLVTIVGTGGMGKTCLAIEVARRIASHFANGTLFVSLAPLRSAAHLADAVASALHLSLGSGDPSEQVWRALGEQHLLLVLDNFEELLQQDDGGAVTWVKLLLQSCKNVQILITSRERLRISHERIFELGGLSLFSNRLALAQSDAVALFLARAQQAAPDFTLQSHNINAVVHICELVDGMPLGIELAAAWVNVLAPDEIAKEIQNNIDFLTRSNRDAAPRHRSMRAVCDHSWALLNEDERSILGRLAVFRAGCTREAAQSIARATLPTLAGLIDKSLVRLRRRENPVRYDLHEVIRQYAEEKRHAASLPPARELAHENGLEQDEAWLAHYTYFYKLAATAKQHFVGSAQFHWLRILDEEHDNLRAALDRCLHKHDVARGLQLAILLDEYWFIRCYHREGLQRLLDFLARDPALFSEHDRALGYAAATILAIAAGNHALARTYLEHSIGTIRQLGDQALLARVLRYQGLIALYEGDYATTELLANEAISAARAVNNHYELATTLGHLVEIALIRQDYQHAQEHGVEAVQILRRIEDKNQLAGALRRLALARIQQGNAENAQHEALESLALNREVGDQRGTAASLVILASLLANNEQWLAVAQLLGAADYLLSQAHTSLYPIDQLVYDTLWQQRKVHATDFQSMYDQGRAKMAQEIQQSNRLDWVEHMFD